MTESQSQILSPVKEMPDCWRDDKRMNVLFSPFRKRELNPVDYDSKMKFWNNIIIQWCLENNQCVLTLNTLRTAFKRKGKTPSCLMNVLDELVRTGDLKNKNEFMDATAAQTTWSGWVMNSVKVPFAWSFSKLRDAVSEIDLNEVQYIYMGYLKDKADYLLSNAKQASEKHVFTLEEIRKLLEPPECTIETVEILLHWLKLEGKACTVTYDDHELIKLATNVGSLQITDGDIAQFKLVNSKEAVMKSISFLEQEKVKALKDAKEHISKGLRVAAKSSLRKKKALEECINKRIATLDNLDLLFTRIKDAQSDAEVFESYKVGLSALKSTFKETGLSEDAVLNTVLDMEEMTEMQNEIQNALSHQMQPNTDCELEEELSSIMSNVHLDDGLTLPDVPEETPRLKDNKIQPIKFPVAE